MNKTNTWLIRVFAVVLVFVCLIAYLNAQVNSSLLSTTIGDLEYKAFLLRPKPSIEDLEYKALDKLRGNAEFAANRDYADYEKFGSIIFCNTSFNSRIESANKLFETNGIIYFWERSRFIKMGYCYKKL